MSKPRNAALCGLAWVWLSGCLATPSPTDALRKSDPNCGVQLRPRCQEVLSDPEAASAAIEEGFKPYAEGGMGYAFIGLTPQAHEKAREVFKLSKRNIGFGPGDLHPDESLPDRLRDIVDCVVEVYGDRFGGLRRSGRESVAPAGALTWHGFEPRVVIGVMTPNDEGTEVCVAEALLRSPPSRSDSPSAVFFDCVPPFSASASAIRVQPPRGGVALIGGLAHPSAPDYQVLHDLWNGARDTPMKPWGVHRSPYRRTVFTFDLDRKH